jgi:hypothetical protein
MRCRKLAGRFSCPAEAEVGSLRWQGFSWLLHKLVRCRTPQSLHRVSVWYVGRCTRTALFIMNIWKRSGHCLLRTWRAASRDSEKLERNLDKNNGNEHYSSRSRAYMW